MEGENVEIPRAIWPMTRRKLVELAVVGLIERHPPSGPALRRSALICPLFPEQLPEDIFYIAISTRSSAGEGPWLLLRRTR